MDLSAYTNEPYHLFSSGCLFFLSPTATRSDAPLMLLLEMELLDHSLGVSIHRSSGYGFARPCSGSAAFSMAPLRLLPLPLWSTPLKLGVPLMDSAVPLGGLPPWKFRVPYKGRIQESFSLRGRSKHLVLFAGHGFQCTVL